MGAYRKAGCFIVLVIDVLAAAGSLRVFEAGRGQWYQLTTSVVLNEAGEREGKEVGYQIQGDVGVGVVWQSLEEENEKLLEVELAEPKLLIMSRRAPTPQGFDVHKSRLEDAANFPFLVHWRRGKVLDVYVDEREEASMIDLKKGIASLFQVLDLETNETDASGHCAVAYKSINPFSFSKTKTACTPPPLLRLDNAADPLLAPRITSSRTATYTLLQDFTALHSVSTREHHHLTMLISKDTGASVSSAQLLTLKKEKQGTKTFQARSVAAAVREFEAGRKLRTSRHNLELRATAERCEKEECPSLAAVIKESREQLSAGSLGTLRSASAFVRALSAARRSSKEELAKALKGSKNREIFAQLCDLVGAVQTQESHEVAMKVLKLEAESDLESSERYLWALGTGSHPQESVMRDVLRMSRRGQPSEKLSETLVLTVAAMAGRVRRVPGRERSAVVEEVSEFILGELERCREERCKVRYLRALRNLGCPRAVPALVRHSVEGGRKVSIEAMRGLRALEPPQWGEDVIDAAQKIYFQAGRKFDSSSRTLAVDILLESNPRREVLEELLLTLGQHDSAFEVKQYLAQRVRQISEKNGRFAQEVESIKREHPRVFRNYDTEAQRGMTTAFGRAFASDEVRNGSLETVLEISKGLLKRGTVDVVVEGGGESRRLFRLGLFAGGLSSFVASEEEKEEAGEGSEEEVATAGMELSVMGAQLRPFVFFSGQGELMGHVWSGTGSERTAAYQALLLAVDQREYVPLQAGVVAEVEVLGGVSFDLSGQIQISLWNRNAHSLVEKNAGISLQGRLRVDSSFVRSKVEFNTGTEVKLNLQSDLSFYGGTALCMQLSQPEVVIKQSIHKVESIPGGKHRLRKSKYSRVLVPGRTYALNRKNDQICSSIFSS